MNAAGLRSIAVAFLVSVSSTASAQTPGIAQRDQRAPPHPRSWSLGVSAATYVVPDDDNYVQPIVTADRDALHLEGRYNYEDRRSVSGFVGWTFERGSSATLALTPMLGAVAGESDGIVPALELSFDWRRLELYSEGEYVIGVAGTTSFYYNWFEVSVRAADWLRAGIATQHTRTFNTPREIQRGVLAGITVGRVEGVVCLFNPGSHDAYAIASISVGF